MERAMTEQDWENLRMQLKTLVDIYCEMNGDIFKIKTSLKHIVKHLKKVEKDGKRKVHPEKVQSDMAKA